MRAFWVTAVLLVAGTACADAEAHPRPPRCHPSYPDFCIPPPPPDLDCKDIRGPKPFHVRPPDPHRFDRDHDGWGCESRSRSR
jgi:micrococcal nuclease